MLTYETFSLYVCQFVLKHFERIIIIILLLLVLSMLCNLKSHKLYFMTIIWFTNIIMTKPLSINHFGNCPISIFRMHKSLQIFLKLQLHYQQIRINFKIAIYKIIQPFNMLHILDRSLFLYVFSAILIFWNLRRTTFIDLNTLQQTC